MQVDLRCGKLRGSSDSATKLGGGWREVCSLGGPFFNSRLCFAALPTEGLASSFPYQAFLPVLPPLPEPGARVNSRKNKLLFQSFV